MAERSGGLGRPATSAELVMAAGARRAAGDGVDQDARATTTPRTTRRTMRRPAEDDTRDVSTRLRAPLGGFPCRVGILGPGSSLGGVSVLACEA